MHHNSDTNEFVKFRKLIPRGCKKDFFKVCVGRGGGGGLHRHRRFKWDFSKRFFSLTLYRKCMSLIPKRGGRPTAPTPFPTPLYPQFPAFLIGQTGTLIWPIVLGGISSDHGPASRYKLPVGSAPRPRVTSCHGPVLARRNKPFTRAETLLWFRQTTTSVPTKLDLLLLSRSPYLFY